MKTGKGDIIYLKKNGTGGGERDTDKRPGGGGFICIPGSKELVFYPLMFLCVLVYQ